MSVLVWNITLVKTAIVATATTFGAIHNRKTLRAQSTSRTHSSCNSSPRQSKTFDWNFASQEFSLMVKSDLNIWEEIKKYYDELFWESKKKLLIIVVTSLMCFIRESLALIRLHKKHDVKRSHHQTEVSHSSSMKSWKNNSEKDKMAYSSILKPVSDCLCLCSNDLVQQQH